jgi:RNA polymerase sigma factor (sigma-70 family)
MLPSEKASRTELQEGGRAEWSSLMARAQEGDRDAYKRLLREAAGYLRALAANHLRNPVDVEDAVQDTLLTLHAIRHTYDPGRPFGPWLVAIARRRIADRLRRQGRARARETPLMPEHETFAAPEANLSIGAGDERALRQAIDLLPEGQRQAITLLKLKEMSLKEAAAASGFSVGALKVASHRAVKTLRKLLEARTARDHNS